MSTTSTTDQRFAEAVELLEAGKHRAAITAFESLASETPDCAPVYLKIGEAYWQSDDWTKAEVAFRKATQLAPHSELASVALFHSLWQQDREDDAFEEAKRFARSYPTKEYKRLFQEMNEELSKEE